MEKIIVMSGIFRYPIMMVLFVLTLFAADGARILVMPGPYTSHCIKIMSIGRELLNRGHEVTLVTNLMDVEHCISTLRLEGFNTTFRHIASNAPLRFIEKYKHLNKQLEDAVFKGIPLVRQFMDVINPFVFNNCEALKADKDLIMKLEKMNFDIALVDGGWVTYCYFAIPIHLGIPSVAETSYYFRLSDQSTPMQTATLPIVGALYSNKMTFLERIWNSFYFVTAVVPERYGLPNVDMSDFSPRLKGYDSIDCIGTASLFLENTDYLVDYPKAVFPNFVQVGGLTTSPSRPLPDDVKAFLDSAAEGALLVSLGSVLNKIPKDVSRKMIEAFHRLEQRVIFKMQENSVERNILKMTWVPQNDILGHPNVKLFVSHCGKNGFMEAVYHGVPILCMPIHGDGPSIASKVKAHNIGSSVELLEASSDDFYKSIKSVLEDEDVRNSMKKISTIFKDRSETPVQRAASAIEHVIQYGADHLRPPRISHMIRVYADVWFVIVITVVLLTLFLVLIIRMCFSQKQNKKNKKV